jgi:hypothetical protein
MSLSWVGEEIETVALPRLSTTDQAPCLGDSRQTNGPVHASFDLSVRFRTALVPTPGTAAAGLALGTGALPLSAKTLCTEATSPAVAISRSLRMNLACDSADTPTLSLSRSPTRRDGSPGACSPGTGSMTPGFQWAQPETKNPTRKGLTYNCDRMAEVGETGHLRRFPNLVSGPAWFRPMPWRR